MAPRKHGLEQLLRSKPILTFQAQIEPLERVRTTTRAFERLIDHMNKYLEHGADAWIVQHIQSPEQAERLIERGREVFGCEPLFVSEIGPVLGTHAGPGLFGATIPSSFLSRRNGLNQPQPQSSGSVDEP